MADSTVSVKSPYHSLRPALTRWKFQKRLPESTHQARLSPKPLKRRVQNLCHFPEKFENRLLGPTNYFSIYVFKKIAQASDVPTLRKRREEWGTLLYLVRATRRRAGVVPWSRWLETLLR